MDAEQKTEELTAVIRGIQQRVRSRHPSGTLGVGNIPVPDLLPLVHARDAAEAKVAAIGTVNPRAGGLLNSIVQSAKRFIARALDWHIREQVEFNRATVQCVQATLDALDASNRTISDLAGHFDAEMKEAIRETDVLINEARELKDVREHWAQWRAGWEEKQNRSEVYMLRTISELNASFQHRATLTENHFHESIQEQHKNYGVMLERASAEIQARLWNDLERIRREYEEIIHAELRVVRQRRAVVTPVVTGPPACAPAGAPNIDWLRFSDRFRGPEEKLARAQSLYIERFNGAAEVLDLGCGRGEFLAAAKYAGISAKGIELNPELVELCHAKGLDVERADMFEYLANQPDASIGGLYCSQVIEHLPPDRLPVLIELAASKLRRGALVAFETPNPECLAIFATHFYLDPTHTRPVPPALMAFYLEEAGFGSLDVVRLSPAAQSIPTLLMLDESLRETLFGYLDYAIFGRRL